jgi:hypothetical protein
MASYARATRGLRRPSLDTRSGRSSSPPSRDDIEEQCLVDARSEAQPGYSHNKKRPSFLANVPLEGLVPIIMRL